MEESRGIAPELKASQHVELATVAIIAASVSLPPEGLTVAAFWQEAVRR